MVLGRPETTHARLSGNFAASGAYGAWATNLTHYVGPIECSDTPSSWTALSLLRQLP